MEQRRIEQPTVIPPPMEIGQKPTLPPRETIIPMEREAEAEEVNPPAEIIDLPVEREVEQSIEEPERPPETA